MSPGLSYYWGVFVEMAKTTKIRLMHHCSCITVETFSGQWWSLIITVKADELMKNHFLLLHPCGVPHSSHSINFIHILPVYPLFLVIANLLLHVSYTPFIPVFLHWLVLAGEDRHRCSHSGSDGPWIPEPPGPGRGCCHPGGKAEHLSHRLQHQLPRRLKNCPSGGEPLDMETLPPSTHLLLLLLLNSPETQLKCLFVHLFLFFHNSEPHSCTPLRVCCFI